jgi:hypothetical protein
MKEESLAKMCYIGYHKEEDEVEEKRGSHTWKPHVNSLTEDRCLEDGDWDNRLLWKRQTTNRRRDNAKKKKTNMEVKIGSLLYGIHNFIL